MALLERLRVGSSGPRRVRDVVTHLTALLNSERGFASVLGDFGVSSGAKWGAPPSEKDPPDPIERLRLELVRNVERYEPALTRVVLRPTSRDVGGRVTFLLTALHSETREPVRLRLVFDIWSRLIAVAEDAA
jgi:predicted component of type VI protein secretion system